MRRIINIIKFTISALLASTIIVCHYQSYWSPAKTGILTFTGFAFPYAWACAAILSILLVLTKSYRSLTIILFALAITFNGFQSHIRIIPAIEKPTNGEHIRIVTLNVCNFNGNGNGSQVAIDGIKKLIADADVVCLQEAPFGNQLDRYKIESYKQLFKFDHVLFDKYQDLSGKKSGVCQVTLSKYPIVHDNYDLSDADMERYFLPSHINVNGKRINIINCHLESIRLSSNQIESINNAQKANLKDNTKDDLKQTYQKMWKAFKNRSKQVDELTSILLQTNESTIVCGDFNDIPTSYTYHKISQILIDTYNTSFLTWGKTYNGTLPNLRIDYIFHSKDMQTITYNTYYDNVSDHFAVTSDISWE